MDMDNILFTLFPIIVVMECYCRIVECELYWMVENKILQFGMDLSLSCQVENCCLESAGWGKWTSKNEFITIFINVKDLYVDKSLKYSGRTYNSSFSLVIHNTTRNDFNISYSCTYGFLVSKKKMLLTTDAFSKNTEVDSVMEGEDNNPVVLALIIAVSLGVIAGFTSVVVCLKKKTRQNSEMNNEMEDVNTQNKRSSGENITEQLIVEDTDTLAEDKGRCRQDQQLQLSNTDCEAIPNNSSLKNVRDDLNRSIGNRSDNSDGSYNTCESTMSLHLVSIKQTEEIF